MANSLEVTGIQWHPGFYGATEIEFISNKGDLEFCREYNLSKEPIRVDLLVIKKRIDACIENELGHIFKKYNIIEYKSPEDGLSIDDYYKTIGYAALYKGLGETVDQIPAEEVTVSIFREGYPRELFSRLFSMGLVVKEYRPGIYYITGNQILFSTQIIVIKQLDKKTHSALRILSKNAQEDDIREFMDVAIQLTEPGDRNNVDAVLQVSVPANRLLYERIRRYNEIMCDALKELMKEDFDKMREDFERKEQERIQEAVQEAVKKAAQETLCEVIMNLMESMKLTAEQAMKAIKISDAEREVFMARMQ